MSQHAARPDEAHGHEHRHEHRHEHEPDRGHEPDHGHRREHEPGHEHPPGPGHAAPPGRPHAHRGVVGVVRHLFTPHGHDPSDAIVDALEGSVQGVHAVKVSFVALLVTALLQGVVVATSGSVALLADTIHNVSDALTAIPLWIAFVIGRRVADRRFTYGYGRAEDLAGLFIVAMIALSAVVAGVESVRRLVDPVEMRNVGWVAVAGLVGFAGNELVAVYRIRVGRRIGSAALVADGLHARTDGFTSLAVVVGALGVAAGFPLADPVVGLLITAAILVVLRSAVRDVFGRLMDAVEPRLVDLAEEVLAAVPGVRGVRRVRMRWVGHELRADVDLDVPATTSLVDAHLLAHEAEQRLVRAVPRLTEAVVHAYPADERAPA